MRRFVDLHLRRPGEEGQLERMIRLASELGYGAVGVASSSADAKPTTESPGVRGLDVITRIDLKPRSEGELIDLLGRVRRRFEVVAVECASKAVARQAAKDHRVDLLNFSTSPQARARAWLDREEAGLASDANCAYEVNASDLLDRGPSALAKLLSTIGLEIENARRRTVPIVVSSGAASPGLMREPLGLSALLDLLGVDEEEGLDMISGNPMKIVERNRGKLSPDYVMPGVKRSRWDAG